MGKIYSKGVHMVALHFTKTSITVHSQYHIYDSDLFASLAVPGINKWAQYVQKSVQDVSHGGKGWHRNYQPRLC